MNNKNKLTVIGVHFRIMSSSEDCSSEDFSSDDSSSENYYSDDDYCAVKDRKYYWPLKRAIQNQDMNEIKRVIEEKGIDPDRYITFKPDKTALYMASETGNDEIMEYLIKQF